VIYMWNLSIGLIIISLTTILFDICNELFDDSNELSLNRDGIMSRDRRGLDCAVARAASYLAILNKLFLFLYVVVVGSN